MNFLWKFKIPVIWAPTFWSVNLKFEFFIRLAPKFLLKGGLFCKRLFFPNRLKKQFMTNLRNKFVRSLWYTHNHLPKWLKKNMILLMVLRKSLKSIFKKTTHFQLAYANLGTRSFERRFYMMNDNCSKIFI